LQFGEGQRRQVSVTVSRRIRCEMMSRTKQRNAAGDADAYGHKAFSIAADVSAFVRACTDGEIALSRLSLERGKEKETEIGLTKSYGSMSATRRPVVPIRCGGFG
jgi:hypothetical protein